MDSHREISRSAAAARLRLASDVRQLARRRALLPPIALAVLGLVIAGRGVLMEAWPHPGVPWVAWLGLFVLARIALAGRLRGRGVQPSPRVRALRTGAGVLAVAAAIATGASLLIVVIASTTAAAAYLAGLPALALAALLDGALSELLVLDAARAGVGLIVFGIGLAAIGVSARALERSHGR